MAAMNQQFKITKLAKDLGLKSKELVEILAQNGIEAKTTQKALEPSEFDVLFEALTTANQISNIGDYLDGKTQIPSRIKKEEAAPAEEKVATVEDAVERVKSLMDGGMSRKDAVKQAAQELHLPKNIVYDAALEI